MALGAIVPFLACPHCHAALTDAGGALRCEQGHAFDVARQGHVTLLAPAARRHDGDTAAMVDARAAFLAGGHFAPITAALIAACAGVGAAGPLVEVGAGTGHHLAALLDAAPDRLGIAIDASVAAARRAARAHPRAGSVAADAWRRLPVKDGVAAAVLHVFAPRNGAEAARVLAPGGRVLVVTPTPRHLAPLVRELGLVSVDPRKPERLERALGPHLVRRGHEVVAFDLRLAREDAARLVAMGPSAHHTDPAALADRIAALPEPITVPAEVELSVWTAA